MTREEEIYYLMGQLNRKTMDTDKVGTRLVELIIESEKAGYDSRIMEEMDLKQLEAKEII